MADRARAARAIEEFLAALGYAPEGELVGTGARVADAWIDELVVGERVSASDALRAGRIDLGPGRHGIVLLRGVHVASMCPHHLLPSHGLATVAYRPRQHAAGLGALATLVQTLGRRLVLQETLCADVARALAEALSAEGALCHLAMRHTCFEARGERQVGATIETLSLVGSFEGEDRPEALALLVPPREVP